jgi:hypothetical protein
MRIQTSIETKAIQGRLRAPLCAGAMGLMALMGSACTGDSATEGQKQSITIPTPEDVAMGVLKFAAGKVVEWLWNDLTGNDPAGELQANFDKIENHLVTIEREVKDLTVITKQSEVDAVARDADDDRYKNVRVPLYQASMFPSKADGYEGVALGVAETWLSDSHYTFAGTGEESPTRFDFRIGAPIAVEATNAWLTFRGIADKEAQAKGLPRHPFNDATREKLRSIADRLDAKVQTTINIVFCEERIEPVYQKDPSSGGQRKVACTHFYSCQDGIAQTFVYDQPSHRINAPCDAAIVPRPDATKELLAKYNPWPLHDVADTWRAFANN